MGLNCWGPLYNQRPLYNQTNVMGSSTKRVVRDPHAFHSRCSCSPPCPSCLHPIYFCPAPSAPIAVCPPSLSVPHLYLPLSLSAPSQLSSLLSACSEPLEAGVWGCIVRPLRSWTAVRFSPWEAPEGEGRWEKRRSWGGSSLGPPGQGWRQPHCHLFPGAAWSHGSHHSTSLCPPPGTSAPVSLDP